MNRVTEPVEGGCGCGFVRYQISTDPFIVHGCHCRYCQRQTGTAFVMNALYEAKEVELLSGHVEHIDTPSPSGKGQIICRCPKCHVAVWSNYFMGGIREGIRFVRVGTLDNPDLLPPDVHIFTESKQPWVILSKETPIYEDFYDWETLWSKKDHARLKELKAIAEGVKAADDGGGV